MAVMNDERLSDLLQEVFSSKEGMKQVLPYLLGQAMSAELAAHVGAAHHERTDSREGYRNGTKPRRLKTRVGELAFSVPQVRRGALTPYLRHTSSCDSFPLRRSQHDLQLLLVRELPFLGDQTPP